jgi:hypothetical protein
MFSFSPAFDFQNTTEADGVITIPASAVFSDAKKFHQHFRRLGGVTVSELDEIILPTFQSRFPIRRLLPILNAFGLRDNFTEKSSVQIEMQDGWRVHNSTAEVVGQWASLSLAVLEVWVCHSQPGWKVLLVVYSDPFCASDRSTTVAASGSCLNGRGS